MFFQVGSEKLLTVDESFARLTSLTPDGEQTYEIRYVIPDQFRAIKDKTLKVKVSILTKIQQEKQPAQTNEALIDGILSKTLDAKNSAKEQSTFVVVSKESDVTAYINNQHTKNPIQTVVKTKLVPKQSIDIKQNNDVRPLLQTTKNVVVDEAFNARTSMYAMLAMGIDPSTVTDSNNRSVSVQNNVAGTVTNSNKEEIATSPYSRLVDYLVSSQTTIPTTSSDLKDEQSLSTIEQVVDNSLSIPVTLKIPSYVKFALGNISGNFIVKFELFDDKKTRRCVLYKQLNTSYHQQLFLTPKLPPVVKSSKSEQSNKVNIEVKQIDQNSDSFNVYQKKINHSAVEIDDYVYVGKFQAKPSQTAIIPVEKPISSTVLYRIVPVGYSGIQGFEFTNVVLTSTRNRIKSVSVVASLSDLGINVEVRNIPTSVVAIKVLARNLTLKEVEHRVVGDNILIDDMTLSSDIVTALDTNVTEGHVYEYSCSLIHKSGIEERAGSSIIEFIKLNPGKVDLKVSNVTTTAESNDLLNVTFDITSTTVDNNIDIVLSLLRRQDISQFFDNDIAKRSMLKKLIAHRVQRVDLLTGEREDFGVVTTERFDDVQLRNNSVSPLKSGRKYRYEIETLLRSPETMLESLKTSVDPTTKKKFQFLPSKFLHPITLTEGVLVSPKGLQARYAKDDMIYGRTGTMTTVDVAFDVQRARIVDATVSIVGRSSVINWTIEGDHTQIDHFLIIKEETGIKTIIGKTHSEFTDICQYVHSLTTHDEGEYSYTIQPVYNDYYLGQPISTQAILVTI